MKNFWKKWTGTSLIIRIVLGLVIGSILGLCLPQFTGVSILGSLFVGALKGIAPVLVFLLVVSALAKASQGTGSRFRTVIVIYLISTLLSALIAVFANYMFPVSIKLSAVASGSSPEGIAEVLRNVLNNVVSNPVKSIADANYIGILFWAIITGVCLKKLATDKTVQSVTEFADSASMIVRAIIQFAPLGICGLVFSSVSESGLEIFTDYGKLVIILVSCMFFVALVVNPVIVFIFLRKNPYPLVFRCLRESGITAFFTRSSAANIPVNMQLCEKLGLEKDFYSVSIPLGATVNMSGAAITITVMTLVVCNTLGISVDFGSALILSILSTVAACGTSGVAGGSILLIPMACSLFGIGNDVAMQAVAVGFIIGVIQDSVETALNSSSDVVFTTTAEFFEDLKKGKKISISGK